METPWRIEMFGGLIARRNDHEVSHFHSQKAALLLAYLAFHGKQSHPREVLTELLWPNSEPGSGRGKLRNALSALRKELERNQLPPKSVIQATRHSVRLCPESFTTDVSDFESSLLAAASTDDAQARLRRLQQAVALYRGEFLPGHYEEWILNEQRRLADQYFQAVRSLTEHFRKEEKWESALDYARRAVAVDPLREDAQQDLMRLLVDAGQPFAALRQFQELERMLQSELDVSPSPRSLEIVRVIEARATESLSMLSEVELTADQRDEVHEFSRTHRRAVLALLFTDIENSTHMMATMGEERALAVFERHKEIIREALGPFPEAREVATVGDSFFIVFANPSDSVRFALQAQRRIREWSAREPFDFRIRLGIHLGEVVVEENGEASVVEDVIGMQVAIAARIATLGIGGQILMTSGVFDNARAILKGEHLESIGGLSWLNHGPYLLRGLDEAMAVCEVGEGETAPLRPPPDSEAGKRTALPGDELVLGWRPAVDQAVPNTQWLLVEKIGEGGFGELWLARHQQTRDTRIFKFCFRADRLRSLRREVTLFRLLKEVLGERPDIARLYDVQFEEAPYYLELEYTRGGNLADWVERRGGFESVPIGQRLEIVSQIATALAAAHSVGVIHRDVKPTNVLIEERRDGSVQVRLTDFGIGQLVDFEALQRAGITDTDISEAVSATTELSDRTGTRVYMAPELIAGRPPSIQSDIYALGVLLYQMIAGDLRRPLTTDWQRHISDPLLREDIQRCVAGEPGERFSSGDEVAEQLETLPRRRRRRRLRRIALATSVVTAVTLICLVSWLILESHRRRQIERELHYSSIILAADYVDAGRVDQARHLLARIPERRRDWAWGYLQRLCYRDRFALRGHTRGLTSLAFAADGKRFATAGADGTVRLWDLKTRDERIRFVVDTGAVVSIAFDPAGTRLAGAGMDGVVRIWDLATGREWRTLTGHTDSVLCVAFGPDGRRLATAGEDETARLWDVQSGKQVQVFAGHTAGVLSVAFSPDGTCLATGGEDLTTRLWDPGSSVPTATLVAPSRPRPVWSVDFSPDGKTLAVGGYTACPTTLWDLQAKKPVRTFSSYRGMVTSVAFSPDGRYLATGSLEDNTVRIWNVETGQQVVRPMAHAGAPAVAFSPDGRWLATAGADRAARFWDPDPAHEPFALVGNKDQVRAVAFDPEGRRLATADGNARRFRVWDVATGQALYNRPLRCDVNTIAFSPDGKTLATGDRYDAVLWNAETGRRILDLVGHSTAVLTIDAAHFDPRCRILPEQNGAVPKAWHKSRGLEVDMPITQVGGILSIDFSPNGQYVATGSADTTARIWNVKTGEEVHILKGHLNYVRCVAFSPNGRRLATGSWDNTARLWDVRTGRALKTLSGHAMAVNTVAFSPDGKYLATAGDDKAIRIWNLRTGRQIRKLTGHSRSVASVAFSPDGKCLATAARESAKVWQVESGRELLTLDRHAGEEAFSVGFSPDGRRIATGERNGRAFLWEALPLNDAELPGQKDVPYEERIERYRAEQMRKQEKDAASIAAILERERQAATAPLEACAASLLVIHGGLVQYRTEHNDEMPYWLSDLVPDYIAASTLLCADNLPKTYIMPVDPNLPCSYCYELTTGTIPVGLRNIWADGCMTFRERREYQRQEFGDEVPTVRCFHHGDKVLNLGYGGQLYISPMAWEDGPRTEYSPGAGGDGETIAGGRR